MAEVRRPGATLPRLGSTGMAVPQLRVASALELVWPVPFQEGSLPMAHPLVPPGTSMSHSTGFGLSSRMATAAQGCPGRRRLCSGWVG